MLTASLFDQSGFSVRLGWGERGAKEASLTESLLIVCDVLRFSSAVVTAVHCGATVFPCPTYDDPAGAKSLARQHNAILAVHSRDVPEKGRYSLSPQSFLTVLPGEKIVIESLNGSICAALGDKGATVYAGCFLNAKAVAKAAQKEAEESGKPIMVLACGERSQLSDSEGELRFALEDYLGAGAILSHFTLSLSPEAEVCAAAWRGSKARFKELLWDCGSGRELREKGLGADVESVSQLDLYSVAPRLVQGEFVNFS